MLTKPKDIRRNNTKLLILKCAEEIIIQSGINQFSIRLLAEKVNYSPTAIYRYFSSKEEILNSLRKETLKRLEFHIKGSVPMGESIKFSLKKICDSYLQFAVNNRELYFLLFNNLVTAGGSVENAKKDGGFNSMVDLIKTGLEKSNINLPSTYSPLTFAFQIWITVHGTAMLMLSIMADNYSGFSQISSQVIESLLETLG